MPELIRYNQGLLRVDGSLAGSQDCCCGAGPLPYSSCGRACPKRITNGPIDSEMAACGENIPNGWNVTEISGCDESFFSSPHIKVERFSCESSPVQFQSNEFFSPLCYEGLSAGVSFWDPALFLTRPFGASRSSVFDGYTELPESDGSGPYVYQSVGYAWNVWISCLTFERVDFESEIEFCTLCNELRSVPLSGYYIGGNLYWSVYEQRVNEAGELEQGYVNYYAELSGFGRSFYSQSQCSDKTDFEQKPQYDPASPETPRDGCVEVPDFYIDQDYEIAISSDNGITIGNQTFAWSGVSQDNYADSIGPGLGWNITPAVPDAIKDHDGITFYLAEGCCTDDYCNPLP